MGRNRICNEFVWLTMFVRDLRHLWKILTIKKSYRILTVVLCFAWCMNWSNCIWVWPNRSSAYRFVFVSFQHCHLHACFEMQFSFWNWTLCFAKSQKTRHAVLEKVRKTSSWMMSKFTMKYTSLYFLRIYPIPAIQNTRSYFCWKVQEVNKSKIITF